MIDIPKQAPVSYEESAYDLEGYDFVKDIHVNICTNDIGYVTKLEVMACTSSLESFSDVILPIEFNSEEEFEQLLEIKVEQADEHFKKEHEVMEASRRQCMLFN